MSACPTCGGQMKPLFTGEFCPKDCDRGAWDPEPCTRAGRLMEDGIFGTLKERFGPFIYTPYCPLIISNVLVEPKPMEIPKGAIFWMDIERK